MAFRAGNRMTPREQKNMSDLFALIEQSNNSELQQEADMYKLRQTFGRDSIESEGSNSEVYVSNAQSFYDSEKQRQRNLGTNGSSFDKSRREVMSESRQATPLSDANASKAKDVSAFARHPDQPSFNSDVVFDSFREGSRQHRRG